MRFKPLLSTPALVCALAIGGPAAASEPAVGGAVDTLSFTSDPGDYIGQGQSDSYTAGTSGGVTTTFTRQRYGHGIAVYVQGTDGVASSSWWGLIVDVPVGQQWQAGEWPATRFRSTTTAGVDFFGNGRGCNQVTGTLTVQGVQLRDDGSVAALHASFEQHCEGAAPALRGEVHVGLPMAPPVPTSRFDVISQPGDTLANGTNRSYTNFDSTFAGVTDGRHFDTTVVGNGDTWSIRMTPPRTETFEIGRTYDAAGSARNNLAGINLDLNGRNCGRPTGTLRIDELSTSGATVAHLRATFTVRCHRASGTVSGTLVY